MSMAKRPSSATLDSSSKTIKLSPLPSQKSALEDTQLALSMSAPILIVGPPCSGRTTLFHLAHRQFSGQHLSDPLVVNIGESSDPKALLGAYTTMPGAPGRFTWRPGVLLQAALAGRWVLVKDLHLSNSELTCSILRPLCDERRILHPQKGETVAVHPDFRLFLTSSTASVPLPLSMFAVIRLSAFTQDSLLSILPSNADILRPIYQHIQPDGHLLIKLGHRLSRRNGSTSVLKECFECFAASLPSRQDRVRLVERLSHVLVVPTLQALDHIFTQPAPVSTAGDALAIGRISLDIRPHPPTHAGFVMTKLASQVLEQIASAVDMAEPVLLVGETGTGKTSVVQHLAQLAGVRFAAVNMSQQSEASDLLGGFRPYSSAVCARKLVVEFVGLFARSFSKSKNAGYLQAVHQALKQGDWDRLARLVLQIVEKLKHAGELPPEWGVLEESALEFASNSRQGDKLLFHFTEGTLVDAIRNGWWILLDEINLAAPETLFVLSGLLRQGGSITLTERGDTVPIQRHPHFRLFACMNPATDAGKKDLPPSIRRAFTEIYVEETDVDRDDLELIVSELLGPSICELGPFPKALADIFYGLKAAVGAGRVVDGSRRPPLFNLRTLTRPIRFAIKSVGVWGPSGPSGVVESLREGLAMTFLTQLDPASRAVAQGIVDDHLAPQLGSVRVVQERWTRSPAITVFDRYVIETGPLFDSAKSVSQRICELEASFVMTLSVRQTLSAVARAVMAADYPVLLEGPTSAGKTSAIEFLARLAGHRFSRINNHEHTDLQEYVGSYVVTSDGGLEFREGLLLRALREGHWLVLDELNLAPSDVLEALNRLLDDNRQLFVAELEETVRPHPHFRLFATQNPAGSIYGGRKIMSRAFRSRFLELSVNEIPTPELEEILSKRAKIAPSQARRLSAVYAQLQERRLVAANVFAGRNALVTLRDLFRWAGRDHATNEDLARNGYVCLAERMRHGEDRRLIEDVICKAFRMDSLGALPYLDFHGTGDAQGIVWTKPMKRLFWLVKECVKAREPVLLVGETGCGKTLVVQAIARHLQRHLSILNCHQNTETGDILGSQRPSRSEQGEMFVWRDGPLVQAMRSGHLLLLDEISLADDSVLERLNSVLEPSRQLTLAEAPGSKGGDHQVITAHSDFALLATMNPGGDYGKKELSPALRSRFTELWIPSIGDSGDVALIVSSRLKDAQAVEWMLSFWDWYHAMPGVRLSLRDLTAWMEFIDGLLVEKALAFYHGGQMLLTDRIPLKDASRKQLILSRLAQVCGIDTEEVHAAVSSGGSFLQIGPFSIPKTGEPTGSVDVLQAPTTRQAALRVARALSLPNKAVLLEGPPGVGKTFLVSTIAQLTGHRLTRINLSEQTDLSDLFGSDLPVDGEERFGWCDGPFLAALKAGHWILLDELNLASQSVLEGLNACLDHRATVYIPELDRTFAVSGASRIFAAQNPLSMGGGRKGLPKSFLSRFAVVWFDDLTEDDYRFISVKRFPELSVRLIDKAIEFNRAIRGMTERGELGRCGRPWEFNLRDLFRWFSMADGDGFVEPVRMIYHDRFRTVQDRLVVDSLVRQVFQVELRPVEWNVTSEHIIIGRSTFDSRPLPYQLLHQQVPILSSFLTAISSSQCPLIILTGPSGSGKSTVVDIAAQLMGRRVRRFAMGPDTDTLDLLGAFEQYDPSRHGGAACSDGAGGEGRFEWVDGPLVEALEEGHWLVLDNANQASPSVLDRLNCLLEPDGVLCLSERGAVGGAIRCCRPHPHFRLIMACTDHQQEVSRAMRNRAVELAVLGATGLDGLAVQRLCLDVQCNQGLPLIGSTDLRLARYSPLHAHGSVLDEADQLTRFWARCPSPLPRHAVELVDGVCARKYLEHVTCANVQAHRELKAIHAVIGIACTKYIALLDNSHVIVSRLDPSGLLWRAAVKLYQPDLIGYSYPDELFMSRWMREYRPYSVKTAQAADRFGLLVSKCCRDESSFIALWSDAQGCEDVDMLSVDRLDGWQSLIDDIYDYSSFHSSDSRYPLAYSRGALLNALCIVNPALSHAHRLSALYRCDWRHAWFCLSKCPRHLYIRLINAYQECSADDYQRSVSLVGDFKAALSLIGSDDHVNAYGAIDIARAVSECRSFLNMICAISDPNQHLQSHAKITRSVASLQHEECLIARSFNHMYIGQVVDEASLHKIASIFNEADHLQSMVIGRDASALIQVVRHAALIFNSASPSSMNKHFMLTVKDLRSVLMSFPANCYDLAIPIVQHLDLIYIHLLKQMSHEDSDDQAFDNAYLQLLEIAVRACRLNHSLHVPLSILDYLCASEPDPSSDRFEGIISEDEQEERIVKRYFHLNKSLRNGNAKFELLSICAQPSASRLSALQNELAFLKTLKGVDNDCNAFFAHLLRPSSALPSFYHDAQPERIVKALPVLAELRSIVDEYLLEFPEHDVLVLMISQIERFRSLRVSGPDGIPMVEATVSLERLLQKAQDWQQYADKRHMLPLQALVARIVEWRKMELQGWRDIYSTVQSDYRQGALGNWPWLCRLMSGSCDDHQTMLQLLEDFMMAGPVGEYQYRLAMLRDCSILCEDAGLKKLINAAHLYFKPISEALSGYMQQIIAPLESDLKAYLKTVHWPDDGDTYWAVREGVDRSHRKMAAFIRKCKQVFDRSVVNLLSTEQGIYSPKMALSEAMIYEQGKETGVHVIDELCDEVEVRMAELQSIDDVSMKQRAFVDLLKQCRLMGARLTSTQAWTSDSKWLLAEAVRNGTDLLPFINCLHQFVTIRSATGDNGDIGVRGREGLMAVCGTVMSEWLMKLTLGDVMDRMSISFKERSEWRHFNPARHVIVKSTVKSLLNDQPFASDLYNRLSECDNVMIDKLWFDQLEGHTAPSGHVHCHSSGGNDDLYSSLLGVKSQLDALTLQNVFARATELFNQAVRICEQVSTVDHKIRLLFTDIHNRYRLYSRSAHKLSFVLLATSRTLFVDGFCRKPPQDGNDAECETRPDDKSDAGVGMAEGEGDETVNDEMEFEEQLTGLKDEQQDDHKAERQDDEVEMKQDFEADLEKLMINEDEGESESKDDDFSDREGEHNEEDDVDGEQPMDPDWQDQADPANEEHGGDGGKDELAADLSGDASGSDSEDPESAADDEADDAVEDVKDGGDCNEENIAEEIGDVNEDVHGEVSDGSDDSMDNEDVQDASEEVHSELHNANDELHNSAHDSAPSARQLDVDGQGDGQAGSVESNVISDIAGQQNQPQEHEKLAATKRTIHDILQSKSESTVPSSRSDRQLYEHSRSTDDTVAARSSSGSSQCNRQPAHGAEQPSSARMIEEADGRQDNADSLPMADSGHVASDQTQAAASADQQQAEQLSESVDYLAVQLCEQLRLVLEPTTASRLTGDYRSGKRLNLRKIIPFIASNYRRDRIWLRRVKPAKRDYCVAVSVDQSASMRDNGADRLAVLAVKMIVQALDKLQAGRVGVYGFGESVHPIIPFEDEHQHENVSNEHLSSIQFNAQATDFHQLLAESIMPPSDHHRLHIIISDGICHDHQSLRPLINQCLAQRILPFLVCLDPQDSITELTQVDLIDGLNGRREVCMRRYLEILPFEHYVIVKKLDALPGLLAEALKQWFEALQH